MSAEWIRQRVARGAKNIGLIGPTAPDVRDVMCLGPSGIVSVSAPWENVEYQVTRRRLYWPDYDAQALFFSAEEPDQLRGISLDTGWVDELAQCRKATETYNQIMMTLRETQVNIEPQLLITTTPRPIPIIKNLIEMSKTNPSYRLVRGSTYENKDNLASTYLDTIVSEYEGTRFGRQELYAEVLSDYPDALWSSDTLNTCHLNKDIEDWDVFLSTMETIVIGVDPSGSDGTAGDETGIVVASKDSDGQYYVLADLTLRASPEGWAEAVKEAFHNYQADKIVVEKNQGGDMVRAVLHNSWSDAPIKKVHAKRGKHLRAQGISGLYEQGKVTHVKVFEELEEQMSHMTTSKYEGQKSPDRLDAMVYALLELRDKRKSSLQNIIVKGRHHG